MTPWPFAEFELVSPLTPAEVAAALTALTTPSSLAGATGFSSRPFWGRVDVQEFQLQRVTWSNGFRALVQGRIEATASGSRVALKMRLGTIAISLLLIILAGFGWLSLGVLRDIARGASLGSVQLWVPLATVAIYAVALWGFWSDANDSLRLIEAALVRRAVAG